MISRDALKTHLDASPVEGLTADTTSGGDILLAEGSLWVSAYDDATLFRIAL